MGALEDLQAEYNCDLLFVECVSSPLSPLNPPELTFFDLQERRRQPRRQLLSYVQTRLTSSACH